MTDFLRIILQLKKNGYSELMRLYDNIWHCDAKALPDARAKLIRAYHDEETHKKIWLYRISNTKPRGIGIVFEEWHAPELLFEKPPRYSRKKTTK